MVAVGSAAKRDREAQYPENRANENIQQCQCGKIVNAAITMERKPSETRFAAVAGGRSGARAQLLHTAYPQQQPESTEQIRQVGASPTSLEREPWQMRHMSGMPVPLLVHPPIGTSA
jgi:hypothetical protein